MKPAMNHRDQDETLQPGTGASLLPEEAHPPSSTRHFLHPRNPSEHAQPQGKSTFEGPRPDVTAHSSRDELEAYFHSAPVQAQKEAICDIGRRLWQRAYVDGNGGNLAVKLAEDLVLCTPTLISKGFMKPEDLCLVDLEGRQLAGVRKRTSEVLLHLQMMRRHPPVQATLHCHAPHATGFGLAGVLPPTGLISEFELTDSVAIAPYRTPGTPELGKLVADLVEHHNTILMANHGVVTWSHLGIEDAYFKVEVLEGYCQALLVAAQLGRTGHQLTTAQMKDLLQIKRSLGIPDPRYGRPESELGIPPVWPPAIQGEAPAGSGRETEALVRAITEQVLARLKG